MKFPTWITNAVGGGKPAAPQNTPTRLPESMRVEAAGRSAEGNLERGGNTRPKDDAAFIARMDAAAAAVGASPTRPAETYEIDPESLEALAVKILKEKGLDDVVIRGFQHRGNGTFHIGGKNILLSSPLAAPGVITLPFVLKLVAFVDGDLFHGIDVAAWVANRQTQKQKYDEIAANGHTSENYRRDIEADSKNAGKAGYLGLAEDRTKCHTHRSGHLKVLKLQLKETVAQELPFLIAFGKNLKGAFEAALVQRLSEEIETAERWGTDFYPSPLLSTMSNGITLIKEELGVLSFQTKHNVISTGGAFWGMADKLLSGKFNK